MGTGFLDTSVLQCSIPHHELVDLRPGLARHARVIVRFEHSQNCQNPQSRFRVSCLRQFQILPQKSDLTREVCRRFALRGNLADVRMERFGEFVPLEKSVFCLVIESFGLECSSSLLLYAWREAVVHDCADIVIFLSQWV